MRHFLICLLIAFATFHVTRCAVRVQTAPGFAFSAWPTNVIRWRKGEIFTGKEYASLTEAMRKIYEETGGCVQFQEDPSTGPSNVPYVQFHKSMPAPGNSHMCWTYPGYNMAQTGRNFGQLAVVFGGASADGTGNEDGSCLGPGREREAMAILMNILGVFNEYQRSDRETGSPPPMTFRVPSDTGRNDLVKDSLKPKYIFGPSNRAQIGVNATLSSAFDPLSVTMISGIKYAKSASLPIFTTTGIVGNKASLSVFDCEALMTMYGGFCTNPAIYPRPGTRASCTIDPYSTISAGPSFIVPNTPAPATITRNIQCAAPTAPPITGLLPLVIASLPLDGIAPAAPADAITVSLKTPITGLTVEAGQNALKPLGVNLFVTPGGFGYVQCAAAAPLLCYYTVNFILTQRPTKSISATATVQVTTGGVAPVTYSVPIQVELNCAPRFESITANIGPIPNAVQPRVYKMGDGLTEYLPQPLPNGGVAPTRVASQIVQFAANAAPPVSPGLANYIVNYVVDLASSGNAIGEPGPVTAAIAKNKVFVHCISNAAAPTVFAGPNIVALLQASDPDMDDFSYFTYTEVPAAGAGEKWSVTPDGVVSVSAITSPVGTASVGAGTTVPLSTAGAAIGGPAASIDAYGAGTITRDVSIVAVDTKGGSTVLHLRFLFGCGQIPN